MASIGETHLALFPDFLALLTGAFEFLRHDLDVIARRGRRHLRSSNGDIVGVFNDIYLDLNELINDLEEIDVHSSFDQVRGPGVLSGLFGAFQELYHGPSAGSEPKYESKKETAIETVRAFIDDLKDPSPKSAAIDGKSASVDIILWKDRPKSAMALLASIRECRSVFQTLTDPAPEVIEGAKKVEEWERRLDTDVFTNAKEFHQQDSNCTMGTMYFATRENNRHGWKHTSYEYRRQQATVRMVDFAEGHVEQGGYEEVQPEVLCSALNSATVDDSVRIVNGANVRRKRKPDEQARTAQITKDLPLLPCSELPSTHPIFKSSFKFRMALGMYLSYAFMHLSGSCWWPHTLPSTVMIPYWTQEDTRPMVFFNASLSREAGRQSYSGRAEDQSEAFDGVSFARFLIQLWTGKPIVEGDIETILRQHKNEPFHKHMAPATRTCVALESASDGKRTNRANQNKFFTDVIVPIQRALWFSYDITAPQIFALPPADINSEDDTLEKCEPQQQLRIVSTTSHMALAAEYRLREGEDESQKLSNKSEEEADEWMSRFDRCIQSVLTKLKSFSPGINFVDSPVKVAILDTGVQIPNHRLTNNFEQRLKECRTWLGTSASEGEKLAPGGHDADGHGTHGTSVLLQATRNTGIHVYAAQVFKDGDELVPQTASNNDNIVTRIVNALKYAIETWKVDVISMSFGFTHLVPAIDDVLEHARRKGIILIAAASNRGANDPVSWPACEEGVFSIYACTGSGNKYPDNPAPLPSSENFAVLGTSVKGSCPGTSKLVRKSGTSVATPLCAAIVAFVISVMRRSEQKWLSAYQRLYPDGDIDAEQEEYRANLRALQKKHRMTKVLQLMVRAERDGYRCFTPWMLFDEGRDAYTIIKNICEAMNR